MQTDQGEPTQCHLDDGNRETDRKIKVDGAAFVSFRRYRCRF